MSALSSAFRVCHEHDRILVDGTLRCPEGHDCEVWDTYDAKGNMVAVANETDLLRISPRFWRGLELLAKARHPSEVAMPARRE